MPLELSDILKWFLFKVFPETVLDTADLPCGTQSDSISCGLYCVNTIAHFISPELSPLYQDYTFHPVTQRVRQYEAVKDLLNQNLQPRPALSELSPKVPLKIPSHHPHSSTTTQIPKATKLAPIFGKTSKRKRNNDIDNEDAEESTEESTEESGEMTGGQLVLRDYDSPKTTGAPQ
ncbi:hypothetical protein K435DRAFT_799273, partial [Dendrothele bispora CBS 962.96]